MELHIDIRLSGREFPSKAEKKQIDALLAELDGSGIGQLVQAGSGRGHSDIFLLIKSSARKQAIAAARAIIDRGPFAARSVVRILRPRRGPAEPVRLPIPGDAFVFPVFKAKYGCCRVLRTPTAKEEVVFGGASVLVATSSWIGDSIPDPRAPALRSTLVLTHHAHTGRKDICWISDPPPRTYVHIGQIEPSAEEKMEECFVHGGWACAIQVEAQYLWDNQKNG